MKILMRADTHINIEVPGNAPVAKCTFSQVLAAISVSLGSMVVGFASSYTSPALVTMKDRNSTNFAIDDQAESWIAGIMPLCALFGGVAGGPLIEYLGRRNTILGTALPFIGAWLLIALANGVDMILAGRALCGFCVGVASLSLPVYLGETLQPEVRGTLGLLPTALGNIGILFCYTAGMYLEWRNLALLGAALPVPFMILMFLIPETPRWHISKGKTKNARKALQWLRGKNTDVSEELTAVEKTHVDSERNATQGTLRELLKISNAKPLLISLGLMFFQQMSGINAVMFYTVQIFQDAGSSIDGNISTIIVGIVNFGSTFMATILIDRLGRKILLYMSSISMAVSLIVLGAYFNVQPQIIPDVVQNLTTVGNMTTAGNLTSLVNMTTAASMPIVENMTAAGNMTPAVNLTAISIAALNEFTTTYGWLPLASFIVYVIGFSLGFGPIPWLMMGEILPAKIRGSAASIATGFNWTCTFIVTKTFKDIMRVMGADYTFWLFALICIIGLIFVTTFVPETRGRSLEDIEKRLTGPVRRMSAVANMKPMPMGC